LINSSFIAGDKELQTANACSPILITLYEVTLSEIFIEVKEVQPKYLLLVDYQYYTL